MPEGDTVWNTARVLQRALAGDGSPARDFRVPQLATADLTGWTVRESRQPGQAPAAAADRRTTAAMTLHSHLRMDGAWRVYAPGERWTRPARAPDPGGAAHRRRGGGRLPPARPGAGADRRGGRAASATSARTCSGAGLGPGRGGPAARRAPGRRRSPRRCSTSATWPGSATSTRPRRCSCAALWPWTPVGDGAGPGRHWCALAQRLLAANRGRWTQTTTGSLRRGETSYVYGRRGAAVPALRHARSGRTSRASGSPTGARAASPSRR